MTWLKTTVYSALTDLWSKIRRCNMGV